MIINILVVYNSEEIKESGEKQRPVNKELVRQLKRTKPKDLDNKVSEFHYETFEEIDCLTCANCCKTTSPIIRDGDITRISKSLRMKEKEFISQYLTIDADGDYVFKSAPCPFLEHDNYCSIYQNRPTACKEYPHTNRKRFAQILNLTLKNSEICPAVQIVLEELRKHYQ